ncbi:hypothetical protein EDB81DRAFT_764047 [Dactylonectria macrodidyma]|uniref:Protein kinase domain-containing protein n=1 Tax=Dactylonectria macrodidyma TaxID=307937 RepID=A0A9P9E1E7_9HYPO|nr:hypothetical protein EDB81DRAFT_764047 [Dactylonectria macrodidyma]
MAELALGIVGAIAAPDLCIQYGKRLLKVCAAFRNAESELDERILSVEASWMQTALGLDFVKSVEDVMSEDHRKMHYRILDMVLAKLKGVITILEGLLKKPNEAGEPEKHENIKLVIRKTKYVVVKSSLLETIDELEQWQRKVESSLFLIMRMMDHQVDVELVRPRRQTTVVASIPSAKIIRDGLRDEQRQDNLQIFRKKSELETMTKTKLPFCDAVLGQRAGSSKQLILDQITCSPGCNVDIVKKDVRDLARKLQHKSPQTFGLLTCKGAVRDETRTGPFFQAIFTFVFEKPEGLVDPRSLRHLLIAGSAPHSMSEKLDIARELAKSVSYVHTFGFVHKNIRPETVLTLANDKTVRRSTFLVGFDNFRREDGRTYLRNRGDWTNDLYRHPNRQGVTPVEDYKMQHDIFSLGICLLEIGLWRSLVTYDPNCQHPIPSEGLGLKEDDILVEDLATLKEKLVEMAQRELPACMGTRYAQVVQTCLTCLDRDNDDFGREAEFQDEDGIRIGVRYIEKGNWFASE